jgi:hypothetical protein
VPAIRPRQNAAWAGKESCISERINVDNLKRAETDTDFSKFVKVVGLGSSPIAVSRWTSTSRT